MRAHDDSPFDREVQRATETLAQEIATQVKPLIRRLIFRHAWRDGRPGKLAWLRGITLGGRRGMMLTVNDRSSVFAATSVPGDWQSPDGAPADKTAALNIDCLEIRAPDRLGE